MVSVSGVGLGACGHAAPGARQDLLQAVLLRLHRGLPFALGSLLGLLDLVACVPGPARPLEGGVVFLHIEQRFFHDRTLRPTPGTVCALATTGRATGGDGDRCP